VAEINFRVWLDSSLGQELSEAEARELYHISRREEYEDGGHLFQEGDPAEELFLIVRGEVQVLKRHGDDHAVIATLGVGSVVGEMSLLTKTKRGASARSKGDSMVLRVRWKDFEELLSHYPGAAYKMVFSLARILAGRLKSINLKVAELQTDAEKATEGNRLEEFASFKQKLMSDWSF
jgi:CRP-like cAMP-binding protein